MTDSFGLPLATRAEADHYHARMTRVRAEREAMLRDRDEQLARWDRLERRLHHLQDPLVERLLLIHARRPGTGLAGFDTCETCIDGVEWDPAGAPWPCPTIEAVMEVRGISL